MAKRNTKPAKSETAEQVDGVLVRLVSTENNQQSLQVQALGSVKQTELPTLLRVPLPTSLGSTASKNLRSIVQPLSFSLVQGANRPFIGR